MKPQATAADTADALTLVQSLQLQPGADPVIVDAACLPAACGARTPVRAGDQPTLRHRVGARAVRGDDASEAGEAVLALQAGLDEPLTPAERLHAFAVRTDQAPDIQDLAACWLAVGGPGA